MKTLILFATIAFLAIGCSVPGPVVPNSACDVRQYQPLAKGMWWVYERYDSTLSAVVLDSIVVENEAMVDGNTTFTISRFTNGTLQSSEEAKYGSDLLLEALPGMHNDLLTRKNCLCPDARGAVLSCATAWPAVRGSRTADSLPTLDPNGEIVNSIVQYRWLTSGGHSFGVFGELSSVVLTPRPPTTTSIRIVSFDVEDSLVIVAPSTATFPDGERFADCSTNVTRIYLHGVGMLSESVYQASATKGIMKGPKPVSFTRLLRSYGKR